MLALSPALAQTSLVSPPRASEQMEEDAGPIRLRAAPTAAPTATPSQRSADGRDGIADADRRLDEAGRPDIERRKLYQPSEFELYVQRSMGTETVVVRRFGAELMEPAPASATPQIPQDYVIGIGDEVLVTLWGSVEADLRLTVDRGGRITLPRIGPVRVAGIRYADLTSAVDQRVAQVFRNYKLSTSLGRLRSIRIYVTGFTQRPGAYTVSSLATVVNALTQAGGPSSAGSFRAITVRRNAKVLGTFDFYDLLIKGDKSTDITLQAEDVIHIGPVGVQAALIGSVNKPAIFELKPGETLGDLVDMAGGFTAIADRSRLTVESLETRAGARIVEFSLPREAGATPRNGDLIRAYSAVDVSMPQHKQNKRIRIDGEVNRPGEYLLPPASTLADAIKVAGGLTADAYLFGTDFSRVSVRRTQQENYERALRDLETEFTRATTTQRAINADEANTQLARGQGTTRLIERLRAVRPTGRIVLQLRPDASNLPALPVEDGDTLHIPARPNTIGVFGSVFNGGSYIYTEGGTVSDFLRLAGGTTRGADASSAFVLRANGSVVSARQKNGGWLLAGGGLDALAAEPGDTIFVPEELNKTTFVQEAKEWTQILYQFGLGAAALKTIRSN